MLIVTIVRSQRQHENRLPTKSRQACATLEINGREDPGAPCDARRSGREHSRGDHGEEPVKARGSPDGLCRAMCDDRRTHDCHHIQGCHCNQN